MRLGKKSALATVALSSVVILLFCFSTFSSPVSFSSSALAPSSGAAKISKIYSVNLFGSYNWAGYALNTSTNSVTMVKGSWTEPSVTCPSTGLEAAVFWVGIDGLTSPSVEQTGTMGQCYNGALSYFAWYEFYPSASVSVNSLVIHPGDKISATVKYSATTQKFTTIIKDVTTAKSFSRTAAVPGALRSSAEWIAEAPSSPLLCTTNPYDICPLPSFGTVYFGKDTTLLTGTDAATVSGVTKPIGKFGSIVDSLEMVNLADTSVKAMPSSLSTDGTSFAVAWVSAGP